MRLKNKVAIVTGDSRGIGFATVEAFFERGSTVILTASCLPETKYVPSSDGMRGLLLYSVGNG